ncbi:Hypothetical protein SMAX5B_022261 [Scophthalmus maximus]|uniref:Uncharacterized protein n=1 Tax=Scophthalmus maximus TaxID=52904 RepID=A0A2U9C3D6_SCOMX|nr:Hypothetical protein SMAX5B_022261 [Scophthalmus maximus]
MIYTALLVVEITCTLVLAKFTLALYFLLQRRKKMCHRVKLTRFSYRRENNPPSHKLMKRQSENH